MRPASKIAATLLLAAWLATPAFAQSKGANDSIFVFGGWATEDTLLETVFVPWTIKLNDLGVAGASYSHRLGTVNEFLGDFGLGGFGDDLTIEAKLVARADLASTISAGSGRRSICAMTVCHGMTLYIQRLPSIQG